MIKQAIENRLNDVLHIRPKNIPSKPWKRLKTDKSLIVEVTQDYKDVKKMSKERVECNYKVGGSILVHEKWREKIQTLYVSSFDFFL